MEAYRFDAEAVRDRLVELIRETAETQGFSRVVVGVSGGIFIMVRVDPEKRR